MLTEKKKSCWRYLIYFFFWTTVVVTGFMITPGGGTGNGGWGTGSGTHGHGTGRGEGTSGNDTGKSGSGTQSDGVDADVKTDAPSTPNPGPASSETKVVDTPPPEPQKEQSRLSIMDKGSASEDRATIFLAQKATGGASSSGTESGFFGVPIEGSVIFLLDQSGSMSSTTRDGNMTRMQLVQREIKITLQSKYPDAKRKNSSDRFRIVCFESSCTFNPVANSSGYKFSSTHDVAGAIDFVNKLSPGGGTDMMSAWNAIIPIIKRDEIRTVYFLSDGEPSDCSPEDLLRCLKKSVPKLKINTISMGQTSQLLKDIASQHKGMYREVY